MQPLFDHLRPRHRVVSVDLRGHGESDTPESGYANADFAGDLAYLCAQVGLSKPVIVGHSFGGSVSLYLTTTRPDLVRGLVLLDSGVRSTAEKEAELGSVIARGPEVDPRDFFVERLFGPDDPPSLREEISESMMAGIPQAAAQEMGRTVVEFDSATAAAKCPVPSLFVLADRPFTTPATIATLGPNWRIGQVVGAGHFVQLVAPDQVNAMVDRFIELLPD
jgi:pimeloyl-ACP methyl ester carboxylesterase